MRIRLLLLMMALGCEAPTELQVTLAIDPAFTPARQEALVTVGPTAMPLASADRVLDPSARAFTVILPDRALDVAVTVTDTDGSGRQLAGSVSAVSVPHQRVTSTLCLGNCVAPPDLAAGDLAGVDLAGADFATHDLAGDFAMPDLAAPPCSGASRCATANVLLCENFESGALPTPWAARMDQGASATFDSARTCRGSQAYHLMTPPLATSSQTAAYLFEQAQLPTSTFYVRAFVYAPAQTWPDPSTTMLQAFQTVSPYGADSFVVETGGLTRNIAGATTFARSTQSATPFPTDRWVCLEWEIVSDTTANGALHTWMDGTLVQANELTSAITQSSPPLDAVAIGIDYQPTTTSGQLDLWIDEVAIDTNPIGCAK